MKALILTALLISSVSVPGLQDAAPRSEGTQTKPALTPAEEDDIREAVFRYQFAHIASAQQAKTYFLSVGQGKDPSDNFLIKFKDHKPPVKKSSHATGRFNVIDKKTGERGIIFRASTIKRLDIDKVIVDGGYYAGGRSSSGNSYTVERRNHKWVVTNDQMLWIS